MFLPSVEKGHKLIAAHHQFTTHLSEEHHPLARFPHANTVIEEAILQKLATSCTDILPTIHAIKLT
ncbi:hypothetical protein SESBI_50133 [Sesbania bispinosa]|nr:hypothetical protein SESBI_50133 [Sesbania bispinosa]